MGDNTEAFFENKGEEILELAQYIRNLTTLVNDNSVLLDSKLMGVVEEVTSLLKRTALSAIELEVKIKQFQSDLRGNVSTNAESEGSIRRDPSEVCQGGAIQESPLSMTYGELESQLSRFTEIYGALGIENQPQLFLKENSNKGKSNKN